MNLPLRELLCLAAAYPISALGQGSLVPIDPVPPPALKFTQAQPVPAAVVKSYGDPEHRALRHIRFGQWRADGKKFFGAQDTGVNNGIELAEWELDATSSQLNYLGTTDLKYPWNMSPDGRLVFGRVGTVYGCFQTEDGKGLWKVQSQTLTHVSYTAFSRDNKLLVASLLGRKDAHHLAVLDAITGATLHEIEVGERNAGTTDTPFVFANDALLLGPAFDKEGRLTRVPFGTWKPEHLASTQQVSEGGWERGGFLTLSRDDRWLVVWDTAHYQVLEKLGTGYVPRFGGAAAGRLESVAISPNSRQLVLAGGGSHKVFDLMSRKVLHDDPGQCSCGVFHPDGRTYWRTCTAFEAVDTNTWDLVAGQAKGHRSPILGLSYSPDGRFLASTDYRQHLLWQADAAQPFVELLAKRPIHVLSAAVWSKDSRQIFSGDGWDYLQWKLHASNDGSLTRIPGEVLFPGTSYAHDNAAGMKIVPLPGDDTFACFAGVFDVVMEANADPMECVIRQISRPGVARHLQLASRKMKPLDFNIALSSDGAELLYCTTGIFANAYRITDDTVRKAAAPTGKLVVYDAKRNLMLCQNSRGGIVAMDAASLQVKWTLGYMQDLSWNPFPGPSQISPDGHWVVLGASSGVAPTDQLVLLDLQDRKVAAVQASPWGPNQAVAFAPDSKHFAVGYRGGGIAVWDVEKLIALAPPKEAWAGQGRTPEEEAAGLALHPTAATSSPSPPSTTAPPPGKPQVGFRWTMGLPELPINLDGSTLWFIAKDGAILGNKSTLSSAGHLLASGQTLELLAARSFFNPGTFKAFRAELELRSKDGSIHLTRDVEVTKAPEWSPGIRAGATTPPDMNASKNFFFSWTDLVENASERAVNMDLDFDAELGQPFDQWHADSGEALTLNGKQITVDALAEVLISQEKPSPTARWNSLRFRLNPAAIQPELLWDETRQAVTARYHLSLAPYERRVLIHEAQSRIKDDKTPTKPLISMLQGMGDSQFQLATQPSWLPWAINYGASLEISRVREKRNGPAGAPAPRGPEWKDRYGLKSVVGQWPMGFSNQMGVARGFEVFLDGSHLTFHQSRADIEANPDRISAAEGWNPSATLRVMQSFSQFSPTGSQAMLIQVENPGDTPVHTTLQIVNITASPIAKISDLSGQTVSLMKAVSASQMGGAIVMTCEGADKPSNAFALWKPGSPLVPSLRTITDRVLVMEYPLDLAPHGMVTLFHSVCQRPLGAYEKPADALSDWNPSQELQLAWKNQNPANWSKAP